MELNDKLADVKINTPEEIDEVGDLIRAELASIVEKSIAFNVLDSKDLEDAMIRTDINNGSEYMIAEVPVKESSVALILNGDAMPTGAFLQGEKYTIPLFKLSTPRYQKTAQQMRVDGDSIGSLSSIASAALSRGIDRYLISLARASVQATDNEIKSEALDNQLVIKAIKMVMNEDGYASKMLMRKDDFIELLLNKNPMEFDLKLYGAFVDTCRNDRIHDLGPDTTIEAAIIKSIVDSNTICRCNGLRVMLIRYDDLLEPHEVFVFSTSERIGKMYSGSPTFEMEKRFQMAQWQSDIYMGMNIGDVYGIARIAPNLFEKPTVLEFPKVGWFRRLINFLRRK